MLVLLLIACIVTALLLAGYAQDWRRLRARPRLAAPGPLPAAPPLVSVLIPARNEERSIARCVASVLAQRYPRLELLVLDDGSTDGTAAALGAFADDPRLRPAGWASATPASSWAGQPWASGYSSWTRTPPPSLSLWPPCLPTLRGAS